jgi:hypothetical protein
MHENSLWSACVYEEAFFSTFADGDFLEEKNYFMIYFRKNWKKNEVF